MSAIEGGSKVSKPDLRKNGDHLDANSSLSKKVLGFCPNFLSALNIGFGFKEVKAGRV